jgi:betaine-aldehyde dehydrogenase
MGAIVSRSQFERILAMIQTGHKDGARLLTGGGRPTDPALAGGFFLDPTVFVDVTPEMRIAREEIFGRYSRCFAGTMKPQWSAR